MIVIYRHSDSDICVIGGDVNGRMGNKQDAVSELNAVCERHPLDLERTKHGDAFIEFLIDNFASVSTKGKSVVDYLFTKHENVNYCQACRVHTMKELCDSIGIATKQKLPDHLVITAELSLTYYVSDYNPTECNQEVNIEICDSVEDKPYLKKK